ncbi:MAG: helicase [Candidatus Sericytochromatia bacterium]|nr:helicase [Candidatus Sericytochromatia bacterium]
MNLTNSYRDQPCIIRSVCIGGMGRRELLAELQINGIELNAAGLELFANDTFTTSEVTMVLQSVEIAVDTLGFPQGATIDSICDSAAQLGLSLCPLELGPHLRLQYRDQPEGHVGHPPTQHRAPPGSLTIASAPLSEDDNIPKGFYLRRIDGVLWLRAYRSGPEHIWSGEDRFVFIISPNAASALL